MNSNEILSKILADSNYEEISESITEFSKQYIEKLIMDIILYVDANISLGNIELLDSYTLEYELSQEITGFPSAYSALDGNIKVLTAFAESYSKLGIADFDSLCQEVLLDFLNLHNGLFVVELSEKNISELSLGVPKQSENHIVNGILNGKITLIPVNFSYGTINFILLITT